MMHKHLCSLNYFSDVYLLKANLFNDLFYILKEILNLAICCYNILVMEFFRVLQYMYRENKYIHTCMHMYICTCINVCIYNLFFI
jgi:hypothetical protein